MYLRIQITVSMFKYLKNMTPLYLSNLIHICNIESRLRSGDRLAFPMIVNVQSLRLLTHKPLSIIPVKV